MAGEKDIEHHILKDMIHPMQMIGRQLARVSGKAALIQPFLLESASSAKGSVGASVSQAQYAVLLFRDGPLRLLAALHSVDEVTFVPSDAGCAARTEMPCKSKSEDQKAVLHHGNWGWPALGV